MWCVQSRGQVSRVTRIFERRSENIQGFYLPEKNLKPYGTGRTGGLTRICCFFCWKQPFPKGPGKVSGSRGISPG